MRASSSCRATVCADVALNRFQLCFEGLKHLCRTLTLQNDFLNACFKRLFAVVYGFQAALGCQKRPAQLCQLSFTADSVFRKGFLLSLDGIQFGLRCKHCACASRLDFSISFCFSS